MSTVISPPSLTTERPGHPCGCVEGERAGQLSRRRFLAQLGAAGAAGVLGTLDVPGAATQVAFAEPGYTGDTLVVLSLRGGFDGLSAVAPVGDPSYAAARPSIAVPASRALPLDTTFGLHPALAPLLPFYRAGSLAVVQAVGQVSRTRSHFQAMEEMENAAPGSSLRTGWIDRMVGLTGDRSTFAAVAVGTGAAPSSLRGPVPEVVMSDVDSFTLVAAELPGEQERLAAAMTALYAKAPAVLRTPALATLAANKVTRRLKAAGYTPTAGADYPTGSLGTGLREVARLVKSGVGVRAATVDVGDWDMHVAMGTSTRGWMFDQLTVLGRALAAFAADLGDRFADVTLVTMSEFGRRVAENGSGGLDHGHGNVCFVMGGGVVGGRVHGRWPGLGADQLDQGDLAGTTDFRTILAEIVEKRSGVAARGVFPDLGPERLGLVRPRG